MVPQNSFFTEKLLQQTERYINKFGSIIVGIYGFSHITGIEFSRFLNTLKITLDRKALLPAYGWLHDPSRNGYILILILYGGYGRRDFSDLFPVLFRLWRKHSLMPVESIDCMRVTVENYPFAKDSLRRNLFSLENSIVFMETIPHQRRYGTTRFV